MIILPVILLLTGCGSTTITTVSAPTATHPTTSTGPVPVVGIAGARTRLPSSPVQTQCEVSHGTTEVIFYSQPRQVARLCKVEVATRHWRTGYETAVPIGSEVLYCYLRNHTASVVASVLDIRRSSAGVVACDGLIIRGHWNVAQANPSICSRNGTAYAEPPGSRCR